MEVILNEQQIQGLLRDMADRIATDLGQGTVVAVVGIRSRGEVLAQRLANMLENRLGHALPCGTLDITLYRDDLNDPQGRMPPAFQGTEIPFDVSGKTILLVDDVLDTGRSVRAAMDALIDLGRPRAIRLAVLVDRGRHEYPIQADYTGHKLQIPEDKTIAVHLSETDKKDQVIIQ
jgi:pyrimidine operon attenuation protein/uracil phosphoribosyltransferase